MNSGGTGSQLFDLLMAWIVIALIFFLILRNWQSIKTGIVIVGVLGGGLGLAFLAARRRADGWRSRVRRV
jgi:hypothetical protein